MAASELQATTKPLYSEHPTNAIGADESQQVETNLVWKRCFVGQRWNGVECIGDPEYFSVSAAQNACQPGYRLPTRTELNLKAYSKAIVLLRV
jgi:hypothetical protein